MLYINNYIDFINEDKTFSKISKFGTYVTKKVDKVEQIEINDIKYYSAKYMAKNGIIFRYNSLDKNINKIENITFYDSNDNKIVMLSDVDALKKQDFVKLMAKTLSTIEAKSKNIYKKVDNTTNESIMVAIMVIGGILGALTPILVALGVRKYEKWRENKAYKVTEKELEFFKSQDPNQHDFKVYATLDNAVNSVVTGPRTSLIVSGTGGVGKTVAVKKAMWFAGKVEGKDYLKISGISTPDDLYKVLYEHKTGKILVFDDCETLLKEENSIGILKNACDTLPKRTINYILKNSEDTTSIFRTPRAVEFTSKIIIITNNDASTIDRALRSRTTVVNMVIDPKLMIKKIDSMLNTLRPDVDMKIKVEVMKYLKSLYAKYPKMDFNYRTFLNAVDNRLLFPEDWKDLIKNTVV